MLIVLNPAWLLFFCLAVVCSNGKRFSKKKKKREKQMNERILLAPKPVESNKFSNVNEKAMIALVSKIVNESIGEKDKNSFLLSILLQ